jgi:hypothetical protein
MTKRARLLRTAVRFALVSTLEPELRLIHCWPDSWRGIGDVVVGMHRQGYDVQLTQYDERGWRATFYVTGMEHSTTSATASAFEQTPWRARQRAAWQALARA